MTRQPINSKNLKSVGYGMGTSVLQVEFHSGGVWNYQKVPVAKYQNLLSAEKPGSYFAKEIRPKYRAQKVED